MMRKPIAKSLWPPCSQLLKGVWSNWLNKVFIFPALVIDRAISWGLRIFRPRNNY
jgi:hypothetical protein